MSITAKAANLRVRLLRAWHSAYELDDRALEYLERECGMRTADRPTRSGAAQRLGAPTR